MLRVDNRSGRALRGVTLTLPGEAKDVYSGSGAVRPVMRTNCSGDDCSVTLGQAGAPFDNPTRQIVIEALEPGTATMEVEWTPGKGPSQ